MIAGILFSNISFLHQFLMIDKEWETFFRQTAFIWILIRAAFGLKHNILKKNLVSKLLETSPIRESLRLSFNASICLSYGIYYSSLVHLSASSQPWSKWSPLRWSRVSSSESRRTFLWPLHSFWHPPPPRLRYPWWSSSKTRIAGPPKGFQPWSSPVQPWIISSASHVFTF